MKCMDDGVLRAHLDGELTRAEQAEICEHLQHCEQCARRFDEIADGATQVIRHLRSAGGSGIDAVAAYSRYRQRFGARVEGRIEMLERLIQFGKRPVWGAVAAAIVLAVLLGFSTAQTWAQKFLQMLRVQRVAVVPVDFSAIATTSQDSRKMIAQLLSDEVVVTMDPGKPVSVPDVNAASQTAGFNVRTLDGAGTPANILVTNEGGFHMTLDRDRMQAILDQVGRSDIQIPSSVNGSTVAVYVPKMVRLQYGNCADRKSNGAQTSDTSAQSATCMHFMQVRTPSVSVPPGLNLSELAEAGLQLAGMSAAEAHSFAQTVDWTSTLVIPIPRSGSSYRSVPVDGVTGTLLEQAPQGQRAGRYMLVWMKNGVIYALDGTGDSSAALSAVSSLNG